MSDIKNHPDNVPHGAYVPASDGMGTRIPMYAEKRDLNQLRELVEYMDTRLIECERELLALRMLTSSAP